MINNKSDLKDYIKVEREKLSVSKNVIKHFFKVLWGNEQDVIFEFQKRLRIVEYHKNMHHRIRYLFEMCRLNRMRNKYGLLIHPNVFGKGLKIMHLGCILTNPMAKVGENCSIHINTAIVAGGVNDKVPILGNDIVIGVGATVLGGVTIADGIAIGAGAVVNKSFMESDISIAGVPARKISDHGKKAWEEREVSINANS